MKKSLLWIVVLVLSISMVAAFSLYGCKAEEAAPAEEEVAEETAEMEPGEKLYEGINLTFMWYPSPEMDAVKQLAPKFTEETGATIEFMEVPHGNYFEKLMLESTEKTGEFDVFGFWSWATPLMVSNGIVEPLNQYFEKFGTPALEEIYESVLSYYTLEDQIYALPQYPDVMLLFYNERMLNEAGVKVPETWEEFNEASLKLQKDLDSDGEIDQWGAILNLFKDESVGQNFTLFLYLNKGDWVRGQKGGDLDPMEGTDQYFRPTMNDERGLRALTMIAEMYQNKIFAPASINYSFFEAAEVFGQGLAAMYPGFGDQAPMVVGSQTKEGENIKFAPLPTLDGLRRCPGGGWGCGINTASKNKEASYAFIKFFYGTPENCKLLAEYGATPTMKAVLNDPEMQKEFLHYSAMAEMLPATKALPAFPEFLEINVAASPILQESILGKKEPKAALDEIATIIEETLTRAGYYK